VLLLNAITCFAQKSQGTGDKTPRLIRMAVLQAQVEKDGELTRIQAERVVPVDIICLKGDSRLQRIAVVRLS